MLAAAGSVTRSQAATSATAGGTTVMYDSVTPAAIPTHNAVATYANGAYVATGSERSRWSRVLWIDVMGDDPSADILDVEPGDASPASAARWADHRLTGHPARLAIIYTMRSEWSATRSAIAKLPAWMRSRVRWWIADPTGHPHLVRGSQATQWYWGESYDISTVSPALLH